MGLSSVYGSRQVGQKWESSSKALSLGAAVSSGSGLAPAAPAPPPPDSGLVLPAAA